MGNALRMEREALKRLVRSALEAKELSMRAVSLKAGAGATAVRDFLERDRSPSFETMARILNVLDIPLASLQAGLREPKPLESLKRSVQIPVIGDVAVGIWREFDVRDDGSLDIGEITQRPVPFVPEVLPPTNQRAYRVADASMNELNIVAGDYVICAGYDFTRYSYRSGDIVVAERTRDNLVERSLRQVSITGNEVQLVCRSHDPRLATHLTDFLDTAQMLKSERFADLHQIFLTTSNDVVVRRQAASNTQEEVREPLDPTVHSHAQFSITDLVIALYRPLHPD